MIGSNCVANGKCTYSNIGLYEARFKATNVSVDFRKFAGSASFYSPTLPADLAARLFA